MKTLEELQKHLDEEMHALNNRSMPDFEGYSPLEMQLILYKPWGPGSPVQLKKLKESEYQQIPFYNQTRYLATLIAQQGEVKLTPKGNLPVKIVEELYAQRFVKGTWAEQLTKKIHKEDDFFPIHLSRIMLEIAGLTKKRKGKLSLTKTAEKTLNDPQSFFQKILFAYTDQYNWAYGDGYGLEKTAKTGFAFSLLLVSKYGSQERLSSFYSQKYFKAFPLLLQEEPMYPSPFGSYHESSYAYRTFDRFMDLFGLIEIREEGRLLERKKYIKKTPLFDKLIQCSPHRMTKL